MRRFDSRKALPFPQSMFRVSIKVPNPWAKDSPCNTDWNKTIILSKNKALEVQVWEGAIYDIFHLTIDLSWRGSDHAGPSITIGILGWEFICKIYDSRHWNYKKGDWERDQRL